MAITLDDLDLEEIASSVYPKIDEDLLSIATDIDLKNLSKLAGQTLLGEHACRVVVNDIIATFKESDSRYMQEVRILRYLNDLWGESKDFHHILPIFFRAGVRLHFLLKRKTTY